jgi:hypothetical protein
LEVVFSPDDGVAEGVSAVAELGVEDVVFALAEGEWVAVLSAVEVGSGSVILKYAEVNPSGVSEFIQKKKTFE